MLRIPWTAMRTNISILEVINVERRLLHTIYCRMLRYFGHIARRGGPNLEKVVMQGKIEGKRKQGRPKCRWIDQIKTITGLSIDRIYALVEDRQAWHRITGVTSRQT